MDKLAKDYPFEQFPHGEIQLSVPRRRFLSDLMAEIHVYNKKSEGHVGRKLSDLGCWPDEDLFSVIPMIIPGCKIDLEGEYLSGTSVGGKAVLLFSQNAPAYLVYNLFDGTNSLDEIADTLAHQTGWAAEKAFAYTRGVFLSLVMLGLCRPRYM
jgi:hypothetical protein